MIGDPLRQLDGIAACDLALYSIGTIDAESHLMKCGAVNAAELAELRATGAAGVIAGRVIDGNGGSLDCSYNRRLISADIASLRRIPKRLVVVQEDNKLKPLEAELTGGLCTHLVLSARMARRLLDSAGTSKR